MADPTRKVMIGFTEFIIPSTARVVKLRKTLTTANSYYTLEENGVDYQVPALKKLWILQIVADNNTYVYNIYKHTSVDVAGGTNIGTEVGNAQILANATHIEVETGKYINAVSTSNATGITMICVELNA